MRPVESAPQQRYSLPPRHGRRTAPWQGCGVSVTEPSGTVLAPPCPGALLSGTRPAARLNRTQSSASISDESWGRFNLVAGAGPANTSPDDRTLVGPGPATSCRVLVFRPGLPSVRACALPCVAPQLMPLPRRAKRDVGEGRRHAQAAQPPSMPRGGHLHHQAEDSLWQRPSKRDHGSGLTRKRAKPESERCRGAGSVMLRVPVRAQLCCTTCRQA